MQIKDLKPNAKNPRKITKQKLAALKASVEKFGDLGGFVFNRRSKSMVSGHQRSKTIPKDAKITIEQKYETPTRAGTVAEGFILISGEKFKYREVDWNKHVEAEAMLAANKHQGEWDTDLLRVVMADVQNIEVTGFDIPELKALNIEPPQVNIKTAPQPETDEQYVKNTPQTSEQIPSVAQELNDANRPAANPNSEEPPKEKKMDVVGKRFVIIIDCTSAEHKEALKEKIQPLVTEAGGKFF